MVRGRSAAPERPEAAQELGRLELRPRAIGFALLVAALSVAAPAAGEPTGAGFELTHSRVKPRIAFFDSGHPPTLRFRFRAQRHLDLLIRVVRRSSGEPVRRWVERDLAPGVAHQRRWDGRRSDRGVPADGIYEFRVGPLGHRGARAGRLEFHDARFPVAGVHAYGDRFGEPRSGGRVHEGQDLVSPCGTPLLAARGGRVQARGYSDALYGYWVLVDAKATSHDHFYAHLERPTPLGDGARVRTGEPVGAVGMTGNARTEFCQLHFELWPDGYRHGEPRDPLSSLKRWDSFS